MARSRAASSMGARSAFPRPAATDSIPPMIHPLHDLAPGSNPPDELNLVVEIPRGSRNKYELDKQSGMLRLDRLLYSAIYYPGDYGFVPRTQARDGDPLDIVCL